MTNKQKAVLAYGRAIKRKQQAALRGYSSSKEEFALAGDVWQAAKAAHEAGAKLIKRHTYNHGIFGSVKLC